MLRAERGEEKRKDPGKRPGSFLHYLPTFLSGLLRVRDERYFFEIAKGTIRVPTVEFAATAV